MENGLGRFGRRRKRKIKGTSNCRRPSNFATGPGVHHVGTAEKMHQTERLSMPSQIAPNSEDGEYKTSEPSHRGRLLKLWKQNRLESHLGTEPVRSEHERPVCLARAPIAFSSFPNRTHTDFPALPDTFASIATWTFQQSN